jgi:uncharacterized protein (DUF433 family)
VRLEGGKEVSFTATPLHVRTIDYVSSIDDLRLYTVQDASRLMETPRQTVTTWVSSGVGIDVKSSPTNARFLLTFGDLISLFVVRGLRKAGVEIPDIKAAEHSLAALWGVAKPFAYGEFRTGYGAIVTELKKGEQPVAVRGAIQEILYSLVKNDLTNVTYDAEQRARRWRATEFISLRPDLQFGQPCIDGTRITTRAVRQFVLGGESLEELAEDLNVPVTQLEAALRYEEKLAKRRN